MWWTLFPFKVYPKSSISRKLLFVRQATSSAQVSFAFLISQNTMFKWLIKTPPFSAAPICFSSSLIMWRRGCQFYSTLLNNSPAFLMLRHTNNMTRTVPLSYILTPHFLSIILSMTWQVCAHKVLIWKCLSPQYHIFLISLQD